MIGRFSTCFQLTNILSATTVFAGRDYFNYSSRPCLDLPSPLILKRACRHVQATICMSNGPQIVDHIFFSTSNLCEASDAFPAMPVRAITVSTFLACRLAPPSPLQQFSSSRWCHVIIALVCSGFFLHCSSFTSPCAQMNNGIPSEVFPSDHVALIADLCWRDSN